MLSGANARSPEAPPGAERPRVGERKPKRGVYVFSQLGFLLIADWKPGLPLSHQVREIQLEGAACERKEQDVNPVGE